MPASKKGKLSSRELSVEKALVGLRHIVKTASETWPNPHEKVNSTFVWSSQQEPCREKDVMLAKNEYRPLQ